MFKWIVIVATLSVCGPWLVDAQAESRGESLLEAAQQRDVERVRVLVKSAADVDAMQPDGATALHWAAHWDDVPMAELLLRAGARVNHANEYGATPLWLASVNGSAAMVKTLLAGGADPNAALHFDETPLFAAARGGSVAVVQALLSKGANANAKGAKGQTPLMWAAAEGHAEVARALVAGGADVAATTTTGFTPLLFAARKGDIETARVLLDSGAAIDTAPKNGATALITAVVRGHVDLAEFLLARGANPNNSSPGYTALHWAAGTWETSTTSEYHFESAKPDWRGLRGVPTEEAKVRMIKTLVAYGANVDAKANRPPPKAGFSLGGCPGGTPFFLAACAADRPVMRLLLALGADPSITGSFGMTPLMVASGSARMEYETRLTEADMLAATKLARDLGGGDVNAVNGLGETALHGAAKAGFNTVIEYLVKEGASMTVKSKAGKTAFELADGGFDVAMQYLKRPESAALLRKLGGAQ